MTADYVAFYASERPEAVAFIDNGRSVTYAQFNRELRQFMRALSGLGLRRGSCVGVGCDDHYLHWVLLLAFQRLGVATKSLYRGEEIGPRLLKNLDVVLSEWALPSGIIKPYRPITTDWVAQVRGLPEIDEAALPAKSEDDIVRIASTTGTTGEPKLVRSSRRLEDGRRDDCIWSLGLTRHSRFLLTSQFSTGFIFPMAGAIARVGGAIVLEARRHLSETLVSRAITHLLVFPIHLKLILDSLPDDFVKPRDLLVCAFGATLPEMLRERTKARLATTLFDHYGSREAGFVSRIESSGSGGIGSVSPDITVEVVDDAGAPMPFGQVGRLKIKAPLMHLEYLDNPEATERSFKDGWVLTEDVAILHGPRRLQIIGRRDEMMNVGGTKISPNYVEEVVLRLVNVGDAGAISRPNSGGIEEVWVAVADAHMGDQELWTRLDRGLRPLTQSSIHLVRLPQIPRNAGGKIQRDLLRHAIAKAREIVGTA